jgi:serine/threonine-protein kinase
LGEEIAHGGMGAVLLARDPTLNRDLAVKVLMPDLRDRPDLVHRFIEEAQITAQLPHPGIVPVHELGQDENGLPFLAMKLVRGQTLAQLLAQRSSAREDLPRFLGIFEQVCQAVAFAHSRRVIHRDLKPGNIMVGRFGEVQVMDWGLAKLMAQARDEARTRGFLLPLPTTAAGEIAASGIPTFRSELRLPGASTARGATEAGTVLGTPAYMPPEQAAGHVERIDERCDVFGLGAILCEILTGCPPYVAAENWRILFLAAMGDLTDAYHRLESCGADGELVALVKECLSPGIEKRPCEAGEVAERVAAYKQGVQRRLHRAKEEQAAAEARAVEAKARARVQRRLVFVVLIGAFISFAFWNMYSEEKTRHWKLSERETWSGKNVFPVVPSPTTSAIPRPTQPLTSP